MAAPSMSRMMEAWVHVPVSCRLVWFVSVVLLASLCPVTVAIYVSYGKRVELLPRDVDMLVSVLAFLHDSPRLLDWARQKKETGDWDSDGALAARLGEFAKSEGQPD